MTRLRSHVQVRYGHFREFLAQQEKLNELAKSRGWPEARYWVPTVGTGNEFIAEIDYPDLATFQRLGESSALMRRRWSRSGAARSMS